MEDYILTEINLLDENDQTVFGWVFPQKSSTTCILLRGDGSPIGRNFVLPPDQAVDFENFRFSVLWTHSTGDVCGSLQGNLERLQTTDSLETTAAYMFRRQEAEIARLVFKLIDFVKGEII